MDNESREKAYQWIIPFWGSVNDFGGSQFPFQVLFGKLSYYIVDFWIFLDNILWRLSSMNIFYFNTWVKKTKRLLVAGFNPLVKLEIHIWHHHLVKDSLTTSTPPKRSHENQTHLQTYCLFFPHTPTHTHSTKTTTTTIKSREIKSTNQHKTQGKLKKNQSNTWEIKRILHKNMGETKKTHPPKKTSSQPCLDLGFQAPNV